MNAELPDLPELPADFVVPDSLPAGGLAEPDLALVLTPVVFGEQLAAVCALAGVRADVFEVDTGAVAVLTELADGAPERSAAELTKPFGELSVLLLTRTAGQVNTATFTGGRRDDGAKTPVLALLPPQVEALLIGTTAVAQVPGLLRSTGLGRRPAAKWLAAATRRGGPRLAGSA